MNPQAAPPVEVPWTELSEDALNGVLESFVLREGTDYGREEVQLATKIDQVRRQLQRGDIKIVFDPTSESIQLLTAQEFRRLTKNAPTERHWEAEP
ncbi:MAG: YheU family protein [Bdellovibrionaceae bacterium]|nr:YheU family protein [Pseudobdellovibrionaceae bacterium]